MADILEDQKPFLLFFLLFNKEKENLVVSFLSYNKERNVNVLS